MIRSNDPYAVWAFEQGFTHGKDPVANAPVPGEADRAYLLGFRTARAS